MKPINFLRFCCILSSMLILILPSCKKYNKETQADISSLTQLTIDENRIAATEDVALKDVNDVLSSLGSKGSEWIPCNAILDSSSIVNDTITYHLTYNGLNCLGNLDRTGRVDVKKNVTIPWSAVGSKVYVTFNALFVTRVSDGKFVTLNGTRLYENVNGGKLVDLGGTLTSVEHKVTGSVAATLDDNSIVTWNITREKTYTGTLGSLILTISGFGSADGYTYLVAWGKTREGENFYANISTSLVYKETCEWNPVSGIIIYQIPEQSKKATVTFGYDDDNNPISVGDCPTQCKIDWENDKRSGTLFIKI
jgi:hypothetical protein